MKQITKIVAAALVLATGIGTADAQRGMRWKNDSSSVSRPGRELRSGHGYINRSDSALFKGRHPGRGDFYAWRSPGYGPAGRYFVPAPWNGPGRGFGPGFYEFRGYNRMRPVPPARPDLPLPPFAEKIPNLTDRQKKDIESLRQKHQEEMKKFREENQKKAESLRKSHLDNIRKILTPEQQKWFDEHQQPSGRKI